MTTLGIFLGIAAVQIAHVSATRFARRTGRFTAIGALFAAFVSVVVSFNKRWLIWANWTSRGAWRRGRERWRRLPCRLPRHHELGAVRSFDGLRPIA